MAHVPCDLARLTMEVVRDSVPRALDKCIDLGYDGAEPGAPGVWLDGNPTLLKELVRNLVDNAINYTPSSAENPASSPPACWPTRLAACCCSRSRTPGQACPRPRADRSSSISSPPPAPLPPA